jgi:hypothetical protein
MKACLLLVLTAWCCSSAAAADSCITCHTQMEKELGQAGPASKIHNDIHTTHGLSCANCHGGDAASDDMDVAMSKAKGFKGKPSRTEIPKLCASCHSSPDFMRKYAPRQRVDQLELYQTSVHGKRLAAGDTNVATCIDCHSVHEIRAVKDSLSPVHPLRIADTCGRCHADREKMARYGIPTNQLEEYRTSVHWAALTKRGDLSAPTCASCHGNHGAKPPQVESIASVCGSCHVMFAERFEKSPHQTVFSALGSSGGCIVCHSNHAIHQPSTAMLTGSNAVCSTCHPAESGPGKAATQMAGWINGLDASLKESETLLARAEEYGMDVSEAQVRVIDGRENLVKSRLILHSMQVDEVRKAIEAGQAVAKETFTTGQAAMHEKDVRRIGLAISVGLIAIAMLAIRTLIRRIES